MNFDRGGKECEYVALKKGGALENGVADAMQGGLNKHYWFRSGQGFRREADNFLIKIGKKTRQEVAAKA